MHARVSSIRRITGAAALAGVLVLGAAACGDDDDGGGGGGDANSELVDRLVNELDAPRDEAECVVEALGDDVELLFQLNEDDYVPTEDDLAKLEEFTTAGENCGLE